MRKAVNWAGLAGGAIVAACQPVAEGQTNAPQPAFEDIAPGETIRVLGTEPFWGGRIEQGRFLYTTPENQAGESIPVKRFAGNSGLAFSGTRAGQPLDMMVTKGRCSDGMSDRTYPYTVTLRLGSEQRSGCAWTDSQPFSGPANP